MNMPNSPIEAILYFIIGLPLVLGAIWLWVKPVLILMKKGRTILGLLAIFLFPASWLIAVVSRDKVAEREAQHAAWRVQQQQQAEATALAAQQTALLQQLVDQGKGEEE